jgi:hypothetical protein
MASTLVQSEVYSIDGETGLSGAMVNVIYNVAVSEVTTPQRVIQLAQGASGSDAAVPLVGDNFTTEFDGQPQDNSMVCDRIKAKQRTSGPSGRLKWQVTATYKNPSLGGGGARNPELAKPPLLRAPEFWTEDLVLTVARDRGKNEKQMRWPFLNPTGDPSRNKTPAIREPNTPGPVTNAAGRRYGQVETKQERLPVFVYKKNTANPFAWITIDNTFRDTVNKAAWDVFGTGKRISSRLGRYLSAVTSRPQYFGKLTYYELEVRVLYSNRRINGKIVGHDIVQRNEGSEYWQERKDGKFQFTTAFADGVPLQPPYVLNDLGEQSSNPRDQIDVSHLLFRDTTSLDYKRLNEVLGSI